MAGPPTPSPARSRLRGLDVTDHVLEVPLDWAAADRGEPTQSLRVLVREVVAPDRRGDDLPALVYLQGGPGGASPRPSTDVAWLTELLRTHRVFLLDQRGTGRSTPVTPRALTARDTAAEQASYLGHFRADSIVRDAEHARRTLLDGRRWESLGQSYGGFCTLTYLSIAPEGLAACYVTGGLPSIHPDAAEVYRRTVPRIAAKNAALRARFPQLAERAAQVADRLCVGDVRLPDGDALTVRRLQTLGARLGMVRGGEHLAWALDDALDDDGEPVPAFLEHVLNETSYAGNPLYVVLQEAIYGTAGGTPTGWAAAAELARHPEFDESARPLLFTGETMFPWMMEETRLLRPYAAATALLHERDDWGPLYDLDRLAANEVPVAAAVYHDDMYVDAGLQLETAAAMGATRVWVTNEHEHDGLRDPAVVSRLVRMVREEGGPQR